MTHSTQANRDRQATAALLYTDLTQAGALYALQLFGEEVDEFCQQELQDLERSHDRLARDLLRRLRRITRQLSGGSAPGPRLEGLYHNNGVVLSVPTLKALCASTGLTVSGGNDNASVVVYNGPVMSPHGVTGQAAFAWDPQHMESGVFRLPASVRFLPPPQPQEGAA